MKAAVFIYNGWSVRWCHPPKHHTQGLRVMVRTPHCPAAISRTLNNDILSGVQIPREIFKAIVDCQEASVVLQTSPVAAAAAAAANPAVAMQSSYNLGYRRPNKHHMLDAAVHFSFPLDFTTAAGSTEWHLKGDIRPEPMSDCNVNYGCACVFSFSQMKKENTTNPQLRFYKCLWNILLLASGPHLLMWGHDPCRLAKSPWYTQDVCSNNTKLVGWRREWQFPRRCIYCLEYLFQLRLI